MITTGSPFNKYEELFKKASEVLQAHGDPTKYKDIEIKNIDTYYAVLAELALLENDPKLNIDPIFTILPTTEEFFDINANTREIIAPKTMNAKTWIPGVVGDEVAEIVYFKIDRYFDAIDLASKEILIQWTHEKYKDNGEYTFSLPYKKSLTLVDDHIVFGWPLTSEITAEPGKILFSVRFYSRDPDRPNLLTYSFSTLTSSITIQPALNFDLDTEITKSALDKAEQIRKNIIFGGYADLDYVIAIPSFTSYFWKFNTEYEVAPTQKIHHLPVTFAVHAEVEDTLANKDAKVGLMGYRWFYNNDTGYDGTELTADQGDVILEYLPFNGEYNQNETYYEKTDDGYEPYTELGTGDPTDDGVQLYLRYSTCTPKVAGYYYAEGTNAYDIGQEKTVTSDIWLVPYPDEPTYIYNPSDRKLILEDEVGLIEIKAEVADDGELTYNWYRGESDEFNGAEVVAENGSDVYTVDREGYYFLHAVNHKNNTDSKNPSLAVSAFYAPETPVIESYYWGGVAVEMSNGKLFIDEMNKTYFGLKLANMKTTHTDEVTCQWYYKATKDNEYDAIEGAVDTAYDAKADGYYQCRIFNKYRNSIAETRSGEFIVQCF